jgi:LIVCS family branched-chain amino acid:cation transporter
MSFKKKLFLISFAFFSLFFGAGNLILPPQLGFKAGASWWLVTLGFCISAVVIPILGIVAHAKLQGTMFDFAKKVSPGFSLLYCYFVYVISISLPSPRTASVTHEIGIAPFFKTSSLFTSTFYFILVLLFVLNRSKILDLIGKFLTPAIILILLAIIGVAVFTQDFSFGPSEFSSALSHGVLEGYQTFDAIGAVVVGGVIIISINLKNERASYVQKKKLIARSGALAGLGLAIVYAGLILTGALMGDFFEKEISRTDLLSAISSKTLGSAAHLFLSVLISLACFTTAVGIVTGTADFIKGRFNNSNKAYTITAVLGCLLGVLVGQFDVHYIIAVAVPALMFIYPITIVLILLNVVPEKYASQQVFRWVIAVTLLFSIPDFLGSLGWGTSIEGIKNFIPLSKFNMGWVLPATLAFIMANIFSKKQNI